MNKILLINDYIEGYPKIASVRYENIIKDLKKYFDIVVASNISYSNNKSIYADKDFKFKTLTSKHTLKMNEKNTNTDKKQKILRRPFLLKVWRKVKKNKFYFNYMNKNFYETLYKYIENNKIDIILVSVPEIYGLYIVENLKLKFPNLKVIVEVRDILNNDISINDKQANKKAEEILVKNSNAIIALTDGIKDYYRKIYKGPIQTIMNGYDFEQYKECKPKNIVKKEYLKFSHVGSIYNGRNLEDTIKAINDFSVLEKRKCILNLVGFLDIEALKILEQCNKKINRKYFNVNYIGPVKHEKAIEYIKNSDILIILTHKKGSEYAIPGKTFEYIGSCNPILAITTDKHLVNLVNGRYGICAKHNYEDIKNSIKKLINSNYDFSNRKEFSIRKQVCNIKNVLSDFVY